MQLCGNILALICFTAVVSLPASNMDRDGDGTGTGTGTRTRTETGTEGEDRDIFL